MAEQLLSGRYRLLRLLGTGGMASVYLAEDLRLGRRVAVKILHPQFSADPGFVARFEQEARIAAGLSHLNLVQVYDVGHDGDRRYIVMEYIEGETLKELINRQGALAISRALDIARGVLSALAVAHAHNLIHRDIKSQNILLTTSGDVKVTDFGIAREVGQGMANTLTATGMVIGTVQYFSPEQAQGRPATLKSDIYAVGIVLYEMLTGKLPFEADNPLAVAMQQINQAPQQPARLNPAIPSSVQAIVLKALSKNPANRYSTASEMLAAIDGARKAAGQPTQGVARPAPAPMAPGAPRTSTRPLPRTTVQHAPRRKFGRGWMWTGALALVAVCAGLLGVFGFSGFESLLGQSTTANSTPTNTPTETATPPPTATRRAVVVPPTDTPAPTRTPRRDTATPTETRVPDTKTPTPTDTHVPDTETPTPTETPVPDTATPTDTPMPTATETPLPKETTQLATDTPVPTDTPMPTETPVPDTATPTETPVPDTATPTETPPATTTSVPDTATPIETSIPVDTPTETSVPDMATPTETPTVAGAGTTLLQIMPASVTAGGIVTVSGSGWPDNARVTLTVDFGSGTQKLGFVRAENGSFLTTFAVAGDATPGTYTVFARDDVGDSTSQTLTVTM